LKEKVLRSFIRSRFRSTPWSTRVGEELFRPEQEPSQPLERDLQLFEAARHENTGANRQSSSSSWPSKVLRPDPNVTTQGRRRTRVRKKPRLQNPSRHQTLGNRKKIKLWGASAVDKGTVARQSTDAIDRIDSPEPRSGSPDSLPKRDPNDPDQKTHSKGKEKLPPQALYGK